MKTTSQGHLRLEPGEAITAMLDLNQETKTPVHVTIKLTHENTLEICPQGYERQIPYREHLAPIVIDNASDEIRVRVFHPKIGDCSETLRV